MKTTQEYDGTVWTAAETEAAVRGDIVPGILFALRLPTFGSVQVDGICPRCGRWHTVALRNGFPSCYVSGHESNHRINTKGGVQ